LISQHPHPADQSAANKRRVVEVELSKSFVQHVCVVQAWVDVNGRDIRVSGRNISGQLLGAKLADDVTTHSRERLVRDRGDEVGDHCWIVWGWQ
jgi:hypothetical protein